MKTRRFATALESDILSARSAQAPGFVSRMMVRSDGLCSDLVSHSVELLEKGYLPDEARS